MLIENLRNFIETLYTLYIHDACIAFAKRFRIQSATSIAAGACTKITDVDSLKYLAITNATIHVHTCPSLMPLTFGLSILSSIIMRFESEVYSRAREWEGRGGKNEKRKMRKTER